jgi:hypothetical protein
MAILLSIQMSGFNGWSIVANRITQSSDTLEQVRSRKRYHLLSERMGMNNIAHNRLNRFHFTRTIGKRGSELIVDRLEVIQIFNVF